MDYFNCFSKPKAADKDISRDLTRKAKQIITKESPDSTLSDELIEFPLDVTSFLKKREEHMCNESEIKSEIESLNVDLFAKSKEIINLEEVNHSPSNDAINISNFNKLNTSFNTFRKSDVAQTNQDSKKCIVNKNPLTNSRNVYKDQIYDTENNFFVSTRQSDFIIEGKSKKFEIKSCIKKNFQIKSKSSNSQDKPDHMNNNGNKMRKERININDQIVNQRRVSFQQTRPGFIQNPLQATNIYNQQKSDLVFPNTGYYRAVPSQNLKPQQKLIKFDIDEISSHFKEKKLRVGTSRAGCQKCREVYLYVMYNKIRELQLFQCKYCGEWINFKTLVYYVTKYLNDDK